MKLTLQNGRVVDADKVRRCPDCDDRVLDDWAFCPYCGVQL